MGPYTVLGNFGVSIGFSGTSGGITITNPAISTNMILQSADYEQEAEEIKVDDEGGTMVISAWTDPRQMVTLRMVVKGTGIASVDNVVAGLVTQTQPGTLFVISACVKMQALVATNWVALSGLKYSGTNKDAKMYDVKLRASPGITQIAPA